MPRACPERAPVEALEETGRTNIREKSRKADSQNSRNSRTVAHSIAHTRKPDPEPPHNAHFLKAHAMVFKAGQVV